MAGIPLARAVFFNRLGLIRDRRLAWKRQRGGHFATAIPVPLGWEHINLTGDYLWRSSAKVGAGKFRPLQPLPKP